MSSRYSAFDLTPAFSSLAFGTGNPSRSPNFPNLENDVEFQRLNMTTGWAEHTATANMAGRASLDRRPMDILGDKGQVRMIPSTFIMS
jgi:hypothetical protein